MRITIRESSIKPLLIILLLIALMMVLFASSCKGQQNPKYVSTTQDSIRVLSLGGKLYFTDNRGSICWFRTHGDSLYLGDVTSEKSLGQLATGQAGGLDLAGVPTGALLFELNDTLGFTSNIKNLPGYYKLGIVNNNSGNEIGLELYNLSGGNGFFIINDSTGIANYIDNSGSGLGMYIINEGTGIGQEILSLSTKPAFLIRSQSTGYPMIVLNSDNDTIFKFDTVGNLTITGELTSENMTGSNLPIEVPTTFSVVACDVAHIADTNPKGLYILPFEKDTIPGNDKEVVILNDYQLVKAGSADTTKFNRHAGSDSLGVLYASGMRVANWAKTKTTWLKVAATTGIVSAGDSISLASQVLLIPIPDFNVWFNNRNDNELYWPYVEAGDVYWTVGIDKYNPAKAIGQLMGGVELSYRYIDQLKKENEALEKRLNSLEKQIKRLEKITNKK
jgi:hypothetical protein